MSWPYSRLLGRALDASELEEAEPYLTIEIGGPLDGVVTLTADVAVQEVSVVSRWGAGTLRHKESATRLDIAAAEALAAIWADKLTAGHEPVPV